MALLRNSIRNPCKITSCTFLRSGPCFLYQHSFILKECQKDSGVAGIAVVVYITILLTGGGEQTPLSGALLYYGER